VRMKAMKKPKKIEALVPGKDWEERCHQPEEVVFVVI